MSRSDSNRRGETRTVTGINGQDLAVPAAHHVRDVVAAGTGTYGAEQPTRSSATD
jgi:hypothetical protein